MERIRTYYHLTKPGIVYSNVLAAGAGFLLATAQGSVDVRALIGTLLGVGCIIAASCVANNYIDRSIDKRMARTRGRALVTGVVSGRNALIFAGLLGLVGFVSLAVASNIMTVLLGVIAVIFYVILYGIAKRRSVHGTLVGSVAGALPPVAGYIAVSGGLDLAAILLFLMWVTWQMPHFYAIAMYRHVDYAAAKLPVLPVVRGMAVARRHIIFYVFLYVGASLLMSLAGYTGVSYFIVMALVGLGWAYLALRPQQSYEHWARQLFFYSLLVMLVMCVMLALGARLI